MDSNSAADDALQAAYDADNNAISRHRDMAGFVMALIDALAPLQPPDTQRQLARLRHEIARTTIDR